MPDQSLSEPRTTVLHDRHDALGASFTDFGGWLMPVRYTSDLAEHHAVRTAAGLFDISHMAEFLVEGPGAAAFLDFALAGRLSTMRTGMSQPPKSVNDAPSASWRSWSTVVRGSDKLWSGMSSPGRGRADAGRRL